MLRPALIKNRLSLNASPCLVFLAFLCMSHNAVSVTGSGDSPATLLETVSPVLQSAEAVSDKSVAATFSEALLAPGDFLADARH